MGSNRIFESTLAVGDVHGCGIALLDALTNIRYDKNKDKLILLGDMFDRHSGNDIVAQLLVDLRLGGANFIWVRGNHDEWVRQHVNGTHTSADWLQHGGKITHDELASFAEDSPESYAMFVEILNQSVPYYVDPDTNKLFIHGGFTQDELGKEFRDDAYWWDRTLWKNALRYEAIISNPASDITIKVPYQLRLFNEIFIGHCPVIEIGQSVPVRAGNVWNLDTGAGYFGFVTVMNVDTKEYAQSKQVTMYEDNS